MSSKGGQTVGYHYKMTFIAGFGRGPINELKAIEIGEKIAWEGPVCTTGPHIINKPDLFGGQDKEGGIQGGFQLLFGADDQILPEAATVITGKPLGSTVIPNVQEAMGGLVSQFRGFTALIFDGIVASMNPYLKEWKFRVRRTTSGWHENEPWYGAKATIYLADGEIHAMNPAHIVYECLTNPAWGKGEPTEAVDDNAATYAANLFCAESFGLCLPWYRQEDVDAFIQVVCDHAGMLVYQDRTTGQWVMKALRDDYDIETIPFFDLDSGLISVDEDDSGSSEAVNEIVLTGFDPRVRKDFQVRAQSAGGFQAQGGAISRPVEFKGIPTPELGLRKAQQELALMNAGLKKFKVTFDRRAYQLTPGSVIRISVPKSDLTNIVLRLGEIADGPPGSGQIVAKAMEDVFALPATTFTSSQPSGWTPPIVDPVPAPAERLIEMGYRDLYLTIGAGDLATADSTDTAIGTVAISPGSGSYLYDQATKADGEPDYEITTSRNYTGSATLVADIAPLDTSMTLENLFEFSEDNIDQVLMLDDELVQITDFDSLTGIATIVRGVCDSIPAAHALGARIWAIDDDFVNDGRNYLSGESVSAKVLTRTGSQVLDLADATELTLDLVGRQGRPYPPADVKVDGGSIFSAAGEYPEPVFTWVHRDRILLEDQALGHTGASIGPEAGTTYTIRVYDFAGTLLRTESAISGTTWTYTTAYQSADGDPGTVRIELESERDGLTSWQKYSFFIVINGGWGYSWGFNWGGAG